MIKGSGSEDLLEIESTMLEPGVEDLPCIFEDDRDIGESQVCWRWDTAWVVDHLRGET